MWQNEGWSLFVFCVYLLNVHFTEKVWVFDCVSSLKCSRCKTRFKQAPQCVADEVIATQRLLIGVPQAGYPPKKATFACGFR